MSNKNTKYANLYPWHRTPESQDLQNRLIVDAFENGTLDDFKSNEEVWYENLIFKCKSKNKNGRYSFFSYRLVPTL